MDTHISIVIPVFNAELLIERCLNSVVNQSGGFNLDIICINDGSSDNSLKVLKQYNYNLQIVNQKNKGQAAARNVGINLSKGKYIAFLDADDYWLPGFLQKTVSFLEKNSQAVAVSTSQKHIIHNVGEYLVPTIKKDTENDDISSPILIKNFYKFWAKYNHVCTGSVLMRTEIVKKTGGQVEQFRISQDLEFWGLLATYGNWGFIPDILFVADGGVVTKKIGFLKKYMIRWKTTPNMQMFMSRTLKRIKKEYLFDYYVCMGKIAVSFTYAKIMSSQFNEASELIAEFEGFYPKSKQSFFFKLVNKLPNTIRNLVFYLFKNIQSIRYIIKYL